MPLGGLTVPDYTKAEQKAFSACSATADVPYRQLLVPLSKLTGSWWTIVFRTQASAPVQAAIPALNACAARYGFPDNPYGPVSAPIKSFADFVDWIAGSSTVQAAERIRGALQGPGPALVGGVRRLRPSHCRNLATNAAGRTAWLPRRAR